MQVGVVDEANEIIAEHRTTTRADRGPVAILDRIAEAAVEAAAKVDCAAADLAAIGVAVPGALDLTNGVVLDSPNLGWEDMPVRDELRGRLGCPIVLDNDVNAAAWGEWTIGAAQGSGDMLAVWVGTGVGGGVVIGGELYHGTRQTAGEIGQTVILPDAPRGFRIVEDLCSRNGMSRCVLRDLDAFGDSCLRKILKANGGLVPSREFAAAIDAGDELARHTVDRAAKLLGVAIANQVTMFSLDVVVIGGGITESLGQPFIETIRASFEDAVFPDELRSVPLRMTALTNNAGLLGAAMLARSATRG
jgi:glucokinase